TFVQPLLEARPRLISVFVVCHGAASTDSNRGVGQKLVGWHLEVLRRRSLPDSSRRVVVGAVARAEPATELAFGVTQRLPLGDAAEMSTDADQDEPVVVPLLDA